jgi:large subunit ribosomal protein L24
MKRLHVKTGDLVKILAGKDRGKTGKVLQTFPRLERVVVEGVGVSKRHLKTPRSGEKGQSVEFFMPIHVSNVIPVEAEEAPKKKGKASKNA